MQDLSEAHVIHQQSPQAVERQLGHPPETHVVVHASFDAQSRGAAVDFVYANTCLNRQRLCRRSVFIVCVFVCVFVSLLKLSVLLLGVLAVSACVYVRVVVHASGLQGVLTGSQRGVFM